MKDSESRETVKYGHESRWTRKQEWLCWRGPAAINPTYKSVFKWLIPSGLMFIKWRLPETNVLEKNETLIFCLIHFSVSVTDLKREKNYYLYIPILFYLHRPIQESTMSFEHNQTLPIFKWNLLPREKQKKVLIEFTRHWKFLLGWQSTVFSDMKVRTLLTFIPSKDLIQLWFLYVRTITCKLAWRY
jgi:hypothetical protein